MSSREDFTKLWLQAIRENRGQTWVANQLGVSRQSVSSRAYNMRMDGVKLPKMARGVRLSNPERERLNQLIDGERR